MSDGPRSDPVAPERLWLDTLQALGRSAAHEIKNALNGVAVNLEVVRARAAKPDVPAANVARFADAAAEQVEVLSVLVDALLALVRPVAHPADAASVVGRLTALLDAVARAEGGGMTLCVSPDGAAVHTALDGEVLRAVVAALLLAAAERGATLSCELDGGARPTLRVQRAGAPLPPPPADVRALAERVGVRLDARADMWVAELPPPPDISA